MDDGGGGGGHRARIDDEHHRPTDGGRKVPGRALIRGRAVEEPHDALDDDEVRILRRGGDRGRERRLAHRPRVGVEARPPARGGVERLDVDGAAETDIALSLIGSGARARLSRRRKPRSCTSMESARSRSDDLLSEEAIAPDAEQEAEGDPPVERLARLPEEPGADECPRHEYGQQHRRRP